MHVLDEWRNQVFIELELLPDVGANLPNSTAASTKNTNIGRPQGSTKRLSDGTCKRTENKIIDDIVNMIANEAEKQGIDKFELLDMVNARCKIKWKLVNNKHVL